MVLTFYQHGWDNENGRRFSNLLPFRCYLWGKKKINTMNGIIKQLFFDEELVQHLKAAKPRREQLYVPLMEGKITLQEYLAAAV